MAAYEFSGQVIGKRMINGALFVIEKRYDKGIIIAKSEDEDRRLKQSKEFKAGRLFPIDLRELEDNEGKVVIRVPQAKILDIFTEDEERQLAGLPAESLELIRANALSVLARHQADGDNGKTDGNGEPDGNGEADDNIDGNEGKELDKEPIIGIDEIAKAKSKDELKNLYLVAGVEFDAEKTVAQLKARLKKVLFPAEE